MLLAFPLILANVTTPILGLVDTAILGRMASVHYFAGAAIGSLVVTQLYWVCGFLKMSITGLSAETRGRQKGHLSILAKGIVLALLLATLALLVQTPVINAGLYFAQANAEVSTSTFDYFHTRILGAPAALVNLVLIGWLVGQQKTKVVLWLQVLINLTNILASLVFVYVFDLGVKGVASATVVAEYLMLGCALVYILGSDAGQPKSKPSERFEPSSGQSNFHLIRKSFVAGQSKTKLFLCHISPSSMSKLLSLNANMFLRNVALQATLAFVMLKGAQFGENAVAVNAILMQFFTLIALGLDGVANAVEALIGEEKGKQSRHGIRHYVKAGMLFSSAVSLIYCLIFVFLDSLIINLLTHHQSVKDALKLYEIVIWVLPFIAHWCFLFDGVFVGLSKGKAMRDAMAGSVVFGFIPIWFLFEEQGNLALWLAMLAFLAARGLTQAAYYHYWNKDKGKWLLA